VFPIAWSPRHYSASPCLASSDIVSPHTGTGEEAMSKVRVMSRTPICQVAKPTLDPASLSTSPDIMGKALWGHV
jgi:hypothetical protein